MELPYAQDDMQTLETTIERAHRQYGAHLTQLIHDVQRHLEQTHRHPPLDELDDDILHLRNIPYGCMKALVHRLSSVCSTDVPADTLVTNIRAVYHEFRRLLPTDVHRKRRDREALRLQTMIVGPAANAR